MIVPEITVGDHKVYHESHGQGEPLILIRGLGSNADHWYAQVSDFSKHYRVTTFDNRGIGRSGDPEGSFTIQDLAADTAALMDALEIASAHVLGVSLGGMIAQEMAIQYPRRVRGLILAVTHCGGAQQIRASPDIAETLRRLVVEGSVEARVRALEIFFAPATITERPQVVQEYAEVSMRYPAGVEILQRQMDAVAGHDTGDRLHRIAAATLVLTGAQDVLIPPANSALLAGRIPKAELLVVPGGGHQILIEQAQACNQTIIAFLQRAVS
jgi:3-oxoadipate enol-lactonase